MAQFISSMNSAARNLRLGFGFMIGLTFLAVGYIVLYEIGPRTVPTDFTRPHISLSYQPGNREAQKLWRTIEFKTRTKSSDISLHRLMNAAQGILSRLKTNNTVNNASYGKVAYVPQLDKATTENIQAYLKELANVDRSDDQYAEEKVYRHDNQYLQYMTCPTSVRQRMLNITEMKNFYIPDMPALLWRKHLNKSEFQRLEQFRGIFGWAGQNYGDIEDALNMLDSPNNQYLFDDRLVDGKLPKNDRSCVRCAVIGNGGILNGSLQGKEIDGNDYVFRVNTALTNGHENDVGTKTSFYCFTPVTLTNTLAGGRRTGFRSPSGNVGIRYIFFADHAWTYQLISSYIRGETPPRSNDKYHRSPPKFPVKLTAENIKVVHPDFERYLKWSWVNSKHQHKDVHRPTTGAIMLLLALHTCDEVNVYGYGGSYTKFSEHYYDKTYSKHVNYANHDNKAENDLWQYLDKLGIINLYRRD